MTRAIVLNRWVVPGCLALLAFSGADVRAATPREEAVAVRNKGYEFQLLGDRARALTSYQKAALLDPAYPTPHNDIGVLLEEQGWLTASEQAYRKALTLDPNYREAHANLSLLYERMGEREQAIYHWLKRYQLGDLEDPGTIRAKERLVALGVVDAFAGPMPESEGPVSPNRDQATGARIKGYEFQLQGMWEQALAWYEKSVALDPGFPVPHNDIGILLEEQGRLDEAEAAYRKALSLDPNYREAHANLAMLYERVGEQQKAVYHWLKRYQLGGPTDPGTARAKDRLMALGVMDILLDLRAGLSAYPLTGFLSINEGALATHIPTVSLSLDAATADDLELEGVATMQFSNDGISYSEPEPYNTSRTWTLATGPDGPRRVYVRLLGGEGQPLAVFHDTIELDASPLTVYVTRSAADGREQLVGDAMRSNAAAREAFRALAEEHGNW
ncbi:MAG TPA: tetratricopeptide repeat protein [bacterium]